MPAPDFGWPLMSDNVTREDLQDVIRFLDGSPILTQSSQVVAFEQEWSDWLGTRHSVFVNSGSSANVITLAAVRHLFGPGEVILPALGWVSDVAAVLHAGLTPVFTDIRLPTLGMDTDQALSLIGPRTRALLPIHILGFSAFDGAFLAEADRRGVPVIEDVCESHGATLEGRKLGTFGLASNFSFYFGHHMTTIEGGMVCTDDAELFEVVRMLRAHGMVREAASPELKRGFAERHPDLTPDFIFAYPAYNARSTEINAVIGRSQLKRLDAGNERRRRNLALFLGSLDPERYVTDFATEGSCNYALTLVLRHPDAAHRDAVVALLRSRGVEFRRGTSGGGNQLRQPYLKAVLGERAHEGYPVVDHVHFFGFYLGNYPSLEAWKIEALCEALNGLGTGAAS